MVQVRPLPFSTVNERSILRLLKLIACDNGKIGSYAKLADDREYTDATDQIREVLIHQHYLSQKDIEICLDFDLAGIADRLEKDSIRTLHEVLQSEYGPDDEHGASLQPVAEER